MAEHDGEKMYLASSPFSDKFPFNNFFPIQGNNSSFLGEEEPSLFSSILILLLLFPPPLKFEIQ